MSYVFSGKKFSINMRNTNVHVQMMINCKLNKEDLSEFNQASFFRRKRNDL